jgi:hypothetical protein
MFFPCFLCVTMVGSYVPYNAAPVLLFILTKFLMGTSAFPLRPRYIVCCSTTCLSLSLSKKMLNHFGVIINNPFVTPAVIFLINNWNIHSDVCNGSCSFLRTPHHAGVDVFEQQAPNNHSVHVHVPTPYIGLSFVCIVHPLALNRYCGIAHEFLCLKQANYCLSLSPQSRLVAAVFFRLFAAYVARALLILNGLMICMNSLSMTLDSLSPQ